MYVKLTISFVLIQNQNKNVKALFSFGRIIKNPQLKKLDVEYCTIFLLYAKKRVGTESTSFRHGLRIDTLL